MSVSPLPCRLCGWEVQNEAGDVHPCCAKFEDDIRAGRGCLACAASAAGNRRNGVEVPWGRVREGWPK